MIDPVAVAANVAAVRERIRSAGGVDVELMAVTKTFPVEAMIAAHRAGCRVIGENYAQELVAKVSELPLDAPRPEIHFIGRLQTNKVRLLAGVVDVVETVDRESLIREIAKRLPGLRVFVQVNVSEEAQKGGCPPESAATLVESARRSGLVVEGLMTVGRMGPPELSRPGFRVLRSLADDLDLRVCSMGMSGDLEVAVEEGSTQVRVGRALFGPRVRGVSYEAR